MGKVYNILRAISVDDEDYILRHYHESWRGFNKEIKDGFFAIFNAFKDSHLRDIEARALKLYIYLGLHANNKHGDSWHSIETIADFFGVQTRTVDYWISDLTKRNLIYRTTKNHKSATTYLLPYSDTLMKAIPAQRHSSECDELIADIVQTINKAAVITGKIKGIYHLFQWKTRKGKPTADGNIQWIFIVTQRDNGVRVGHYYNLKTYEHYGVQELNLDDIYVFQSCFKIDGKPIQGVAIPHGFQIDDAQNRQHILEIIEDLSKVNESILKDFPELQYGPVSELLPNVSQDETHDNNSEDSKDQAGGETNE